MRSLKKLVTTHGFKNFLQEHITLLILIFQITGGKLLSYHHSNAQFKMPNDPNVPVIMISAGSGIAPFRHGLLNRWTLQYDWGNTTGGLERIVNILQISHHI